MQTNHHMFFVSIRQSPPQIEDNAKIVQEQSEELGLSDPDSEDEQQELVAEEKSAPLPIDFSPSGF